MAQGVDKKSRAQQAADELSTLIIEGSEFQPGDRLPNEMELSNRFHVSRTTLREAIRTLSERGLVEVRHGIGTFVSDQLPALSDYGFQDLANLKVDIRDLFETRLIFEPQVAALAVQRASEAELEQLLQLQISIETAYTQGQDVSDYDRQFHNLLIRCAHNPFLEQIVHVINDAIRNLLMVIELDEAQAMVTSDVRSIADFVKRRDSIGVECALKMHILHSLQLLDTYEI